MTGTLPRIPLRGEDVALAAWNLVSIRVGAALGSSWNGTEQNLPIGLMELVAIIGVIVAIGTRTHGSAAVQAESFRGWIIAGPLVGATGLIGSNASDRLGLDLGILGVLVLVTIVGAFVFTDRLPVLPELYRRLLTAPFVFVSAAFFADFIAGILGGFDLGALARDAFGGAFTSGELVVGAFLLFALVLASAVFYAMLVIAPRELAAAEPHPEVWLTRFLVFFVSAAIGAGGWLLL